MTVQMSEAQFDARKQNMEAQVAQVFQVSPQQVLMLCRNCRKLGRLWRRRLLNNDGLDLLVIISSKVEVVSVAASTCEQTESAFCPVLPNTTNTIQKALTNFSLLEIKSPPTCTRCVNAEHLEFASSGSRDRQFSCKKQCSEGYFRILNLDSQACFPHTVPTCPDGQYVESGTRQHDAFCAPCSGCEGRRLVANCSQYSNTVCEDCGSGKERQHWKGTECQPACDDGFVWDVKRNECQFCGTYVWKGGEDGAWGKDVTKCPPGFHKPAEPDNCTHCVPCIGLPENADWGAQDDREDCVWLCKDEYELQNTASGDACVLRKGVENAPKITSMENECDPGSIPIAFTCTPCFDAAKLEGSGVQFSDLPVAMQNGKTWDWTFGCRWQCRHVENFWEIQASSGKYWECKELSQRDELLEDDLSWLRRSGVSPQTPSSVSLNASSVDKTEERSTLLNIAVFVGALPAAALVCALLVGCWRMFAADDDQHKLSEDEQI